MKSFSFIIPVRIDNSDRFSNLEASLKYIRKNFSESEIIIVENAPNSQIADLLHRFHDVKHVFIENNHEFSRSRTINAGAAIAKRKYLIIYDLDVFIHPQAIHKSARILKRGNTKIILPHNTIFVNVSGETKKRIMDSLEITSIPGIHSLQSRISNPDITAYPVPSGVIIFDRNVFLAMGGFNKNMISYGWEDVEILKRMIKLGFYPHFLRQYNVIHLDHKRGSDSAMNDFYIRNKAEFLNVMSLSKKQLLAYIKNNLALDFGSEFIQQLPNIKLPVRMAQRTLYFINLLQNQLMLRGFTGLLTYVVNRR